MEQSFGLNQATSIFDPSAKELMEKSKMISTNTSREFKTQKDVRSNPALQNETEYSKVNLTERAVGGEMTS